MRWAPTLTLLACLGANMCFAQEPEPLPFAGAGIIACSDFRAALSSAEDQFTRLAWETDAYSWALGFWSRRNMEVINSGEQPRNLRVRRADVVDRIVGWCVDHPEQVLGSAIIETYDSLELIEEFEAPQ